MSTVSEMTGLESNEPTPRPVRKVNPFVVIIVLVGLLVLIGGFALALVKSNLSQVEGGVAPDFMITTFDGKPFSLSQQRGKVTLINFWASWCGPCRSEAGDMNAIWDEFKDRGVQFIGIAHLDNEGDSLAFNKEFGVQYPTGPDNGTQVSDAYRIKAVPETYIVDQKGNLVMTIPGPATAKDLRDILNKLLAS